MGNPLVLITGATGHVGFRTLVFALEAGYAVRAAIRKPEQAKKISSTASVKPFVDNLTFVQVPDITARDAYVEAMKGVDCALHLASPIPDFEYAGSDWDGHFYQPAVKGTLSILEAASKTPSLKRLVITSTINVLQAPAGKDVAGPYDIIAASNSGAAQHQFEAYVISKALAIAAAADFTKKNKVEFDLITIFPGNVVGANELNEYREDVANSSNFVMLDIARGRKSPEPLLTSQVFLDDAAKAYLLALDPKRASNGQNFILVGNGGLGWLCDEVASHVRGIYPKEIANGTLAPTVGQESLVTKYDTHSSEDLLGIRFTGIEEMVRSTVGQYLSLPSRG